MRIKSTISGSSDGGYCDASVGICASKSFFEFHSSLLNPWNSYGISVPSIITVNTPTPRIPTSIYCNGIFN
jgi:hypothetical protein